MWRENTHRQVEKALMDGLEYAKNALEYDTSSGYILGHIYIHYSHQLLSSHLQRTDSDPIPEWLSRWGFIIRY